MNPKKTLARLGAIQLIYDLDFNNKLTDTAQELDSNEDYLENKIAYLVQFQEAGKIQKNYAKLLVNGVVTYLETIDNKIIPNLGQGWDIDKIGLTTRAILRCGTFELISQKELSANIIISEYIKLAQELIDEEKLSFVNAILDKISKEVK